MKGKPNRGPLPRGFALVGLVFVMAAGGLVAASKTATAARPAPPNTQAQLSSLREQVKHLQQLVPNQSTVMTHVAYHFTNLWFAASEQNWPLAAFYVGEVRDNLKWAVRVRPIRDGPSGEVNLAGIAEALDNTELTQLQKAVESKRKEDFVRAYDATTMVCHSCHQAVGKPYLRVQRPSFPEVEVITFPPDTSSTEQSHAEGSAVDEGGRRSGSLTQ